LPPETPGHRSFDAHVCSFEWTDSAMLAVSPMLCWSLGASFGTEKHPLNLIRIMPA